MKINHLPSQAQDEYKGKRSELENYGWAIYLVEVISATLSGVSSAGQFSAPRMDWQKIERSATVVVIPPLSCYISRARQASQYG